MTSRPVARKPASFPAAGPTPASIVDGFRKALDAAEAFAGATAPNPPVGCTILDADGATLVCTAHERAGGGHAEALAIAACRQAGVFERIHTVIVTLEPCNHHGRTPPCVDAILATPAEAVWIGAADPNPGVRGGGAARLATEGVAVAFLDAMDGPEAAALTRQAQRLIGPFKVWSIQGRPWLTLKQALTAQGGMVPPPGEKTFTSAKSLILAHGLRRRADAIVTGSGCVLADDPAFTVRHVADPRTTPRRLAILDRRGRTPQAYIAAARARGFEVGVYAEISTMLADLAAGGVLEALVECGPRLLQSFLAADLWDEQVVIRQSATPGAPDTVDVVTRPAALMRPL